MPGDVLHDAHAGRIAGMPVAPPAAPWRKGVEPGEVGPFRYGAGRRHPGHLAPAWASLGHMPRPVGFKQAGALPSLPSVSSPRHISPVPRSLAGSGPGLSAGGVNRLLLRLLSHAGETLLLRGCWSGKGTVLGRVTRREREVAAPWRCS
jgi:hypothetical protein